MFGSLRSSARPRATSPFGRLLGDRSPRGAEVGRGEHVGVVVAAAMAVERDVGGARLRARRQHVGDVGPLRHAGDLRRDVGPRLARILRHADHAVVAADPHHALPRGGLFERDDVAEGADAVVLGDADVLADDAHDRQRFAIGVGGEVGADRLIRAAAIRRLQHQVGADVDRRRIERRQLHRGVPVEAIRPAVRPASCSAGSGRIVVRSLVNRSVRLMRPSCDSA